MQDRSDIRSVQPGAGLYAGHRACARWLQHISVYVQAGKDTQKCAGLGCMRYQAEPREAARPQPVCKLRSTNGAGAALSPHVGNRAAGPNIRTRSAAVVLICLYASKQAKLSGAEPRRPKYMQGGSAQRMRSVSTRRGEIGTRSVTSRSQSVKAAVQGQWQARLMCYNIDPAATWQIRSARSCHVGRRISGSSWQ
jgi:hypothetical protein